LLQLDVYSPGINNFGLNYLIMNDVFLGLGTNLGNRKSNLRNAVDRIGENIGPVVKSSSVYETEPWGFEADNDFYNMVVGIETKMSPSDMMNQIRLIESSLGRERDQDRYSSRIIDIDILFYGDQVSEEKGLKIPHRLIHERKFVLVPMCELAPDFVHPGSGKSIRVLLDECRDRSRIIKL
jgi:2-amino-4-hydroxy-6-hydroxymethyldihydropteridine diphosphokinase